MPANSPSVPSFLGWFLTSSLLRRLGAHHPHGFYLLSLAVLCERFAASILSSSVVLMLCQRYGYGRSDALRLVGLYNAASYFLTLPGGLALDRLLGARRALGTGLLLLTCGYAALTLSHPAALWLSVSLLLVGHALFKPSTQAVMVLLYDRYDPRFESAQIVCYLGINAAASAGAVSAGLLVRGYDFRATYSLAAAVLLIGAALVFWGKHALCLRQSIPTSSAERASVPITMSTARRIKLISALTLAMMLFTVGFGQVEGGLFLFAQDRTDRLLFGFEIPSAWFVGLPSLLVLILAPLQLVLLPRIRHAVSTPKLVSLGLFSVALAFAILIPPALYAEGHRVSMLWLLSCMTLLVIGELLITPLSLSLLLRLTPPRAVGAVMGVWFVAGAVGCWLAGEIGALWMKFTFPSCAPVVASAPASASADTSRSLHRAESRPRST